MVKALVNTFDFLILYNITSYINIKKNRALRQETSYVNLAEFREKLNLGISMLTAELNQAKVQPNVCKLRRDQEVRT